MVRLAMPVIKANAVGMTCRGPGMSGTGIEDQV